MELRKIKINYYNNNYFLLVENGTIMQPGVYSYEFHCNLPRILPTSIEAGLCHIRYIARMVHDIPSLPNTDIGEVFTVIKPLNLNSDPSWRVSETNDQLDRNSTK